MQRRLLAVVLGASAVVVAVGAFAATAGAAPTARASDHLTLLSKPQTAGDALPAFVAASELGDEGLLAGSTRLLGQSQGAWHWVAEDKSGQVCLVTMLGSTPADQVIGATCTAPAAFARRGLTLQVAGPATASEAHLLPDGYSAAAKARPELTVLSPNLAVSDPYASPAASAIPLAPAKGAASALQLDNLAAVRS
jgi:hypothetical protein